MKFLSALLITLCLYVTHVYGYGTETVELSGKWYPSETPSSLVHRENIQGDGFSGGFWQFPTSDLSGDLFQSLKASGLNVGDYEIWGSNEEGKKGTLVPEATPKLVVPVGPFVCFIFPFKFIVVVVIKPIIIVVAIKVIVIICIKVAGDPQFLGLQGQDYQFHGMADEIFNLISAPDVQVNSQFKYLSSGKCDYNDTVCWTHPGTYLDQIGIQYGNDRILLQSGSHNSGMRVFINDQEQYPSLSASAPHTLVNGNQIALMKYTSSAQFAFETDLMSMRIINSDYFFNFDYSIKDSSVIRAGARPLFITGEICELESTKSRISGTTSSKVSKLLKETYPAIPLHGLLGQTWRNAQFCGRYFEGSVDDYVSGGLFASAYTFNYFQPNPQQTPM